MAMVGRGSSVDLGFDLCARDGSIIGVLIGLILLRWFLAGGWWMRLKGCLGFDLWC